MPNLTIQEVATGAYLPALWQLAIQDDTQTLMQAACAAFVFDPFMLWEASEMPDGIDPDLIDALYHSRNVPELHPAYGGLVADMRNPDTDWPTLAAHAEADMEYLFADSSPMLMDLAYLSSGQVMLPVMGVILDSQYYEINHNDPIVQAAYPVAQLLGIETGEQAALERARQIAEFLEAAGESQLSKAILFVIQDTPYDLLNYSEEEAFYMEMAFIPMADYFNDNWPVEIAEANDYLAEALNGLERINTDDYIRALFQFNLLVHTYTKETPTDVPATQNRFIWPTSHLQDACQAAHDLELLPVRHRAPSGDRQRHRRNAAVRRTTRQGLRQSQRAMAIGHPHARPALHRAA